jgi:hypothetical protein
LNNPTLGMGHGFCCCQSKKGQKVGKVLEVSAALATHGTYTSKSQ